MMKKTSVCSELSSENTRFDETKDKLNLCSDTDLVPNHQDASNFLDKRKSESEVRGKYLPSSIGLDPIVYTTDKSFECEVCYKGFTRKSYLNRHYAIHSNEKPHQCNSCEKSFRERSNLKVHQRTQHSNEYRYTCDLCGKSFKKNASLKYHYVSHTRMKEKPSKINLCDKYSKLGLEIQESVQSPISTIDEEASILKNKDQKVSSDQSNENVTLINRHRSYDGVYKFRCVICNKGYDKKRSMYGHYRTHKESFTCEICNKSFNFKTSLARHLLTHTGERPFQCEECNKSFAAMCELRKHCRIHTGERPYQCNICNDTFRESGALKKHYFTHITEKPFKCSWCPKQFLWQSKLDMHYVSHLKQNSEEN